mgnify:CR=1 FL=1
MGKRTEEEIDRVPQQDVDSRHDLREQMQILQFVPAINQPINSLRSKKNVTHLTYKNQVEKVNLQQLMS